MARLTTPVQITLKPTQSQRASWAHAAMSRGQDTRSFIVWSLDYMARYVSEVHLQNFHRKEDPILLRLEEKKRLRALVDAAWHALDFLPPPSPCPVRDSIRDPKGDLRRALDDLHDYLDEVQEEYPKGERLGIGGGSEEPPPSVCFLEEGRPLALTGSSKTSRLFSFLGGHLLP